MICNWESPYNCFHDFTVSLFPTYLPAWFASLLLHWTPAWTMNIIFFLPGGRRWPYSVVLFCQIGSGLKASLESLEIANSWKRQRSWRFWSCCHLLRSSVFSRSSTAFSSSVSMPESLKNLITGLCLQTFFHQPVRCFWSWGRDKQGEGICFGVFASIWWVRVGGREDRGENLKFSQLLLCLRIVFIEGIVRGLTCQNLAPMFDLWYPRESQYIHNPFNMWVFKTFT